MLFQFLCVINIFCELRAFKDIFPNLNDNIKEAASKKTGYIKYNNKTAGINLICAPYNGVGIDQKIGNTVLAIDPGYVVESITLIAVTPNSVSLLDIYNALGNIRDLKGRLYPSETRKQEVPLFEEATRIASERKTTPIPDPPPAENLPGGDTVFLRLKDVNFGNTFYRAEMSLFQYGLSYKLTNFRSLNYFILPVIKEGRFIAHMYIEPIQEGVLIYSIAGTDVNDFIASRIDIESAIAKRLNVIVSWASDGIQIRGKNY